MSTRVNEVGQGVTEKRSRVSDRSVKRLLSFLCRKIANTATQNPQNNYSALKELHFKFKTTPIIFFAESLCTLFPSLRTVPVSPAIPGPSHAADESEDVQVNSNQ